MIGWRSPIPAVECPITDPEGFREAQHSEYRLFFFFFRVARTITRRPVFVRFTSKLDGRLNLTVGSYAHDSPSYLYFVHVSKLTSQPRNDKFSIKSYQIKKKGKKSEWRDLQASIGMVTPGQTIRIRIIQGYMDAFNT